MNLHHSAAVAALLCMASAAHADTARCHVIYGGEEWVVDAQPTAQPYRVASRKIGRYFEFKLVYADLPDQGKFVRTYAYGTSGDTPVLIQQASYRPLFDPRADGWGFTGFQYVYEPSKGSELQYWCQWLP
ncbi:hypothetical protein [Thermomonas sp.]|uniref:hypothetical protein n=1 Tax=Thermomonas sp. TaxID=1971895 RepID=UPI0035B1C199